MTIIWVNRSYKILHNEFANVGAGKPGERANQMLNLDNPEIDWVHLAKGMGVEGVRVGTMEAFTRALQAGVQQRGPFLIEVTLQPSHAALLVQPLALRPQGDGGGA